MSTTSDVRQDVKKAKKFATIAVTAARLEQAPWVQFSMTADFIDGGGKQEDKSKLKFDAGEGPFELTFELEDDTKGRKLGFLPTFAEAMWIAVGTECPDGAGNGGGAISGGPPTEKRLVVTNLNAVEQVLTFALRFRGLPAPDGTTLYVYDPQIINGGGSNLD
jgi:hypothetical protein